tara:strand:+ start:13616 stop:14101 length:486 start_codon:yes stop_codon:yes gene_type:complete
MQQSDLEHVLIWRNQPEVRRWMYSRHEIAMVEHQAWFTSSNQNPLRHLLIYQDQHHALGFAHIQQKVSCPRVADWGFYLAPDAGKGSGHKLGEAVLDYAFANLELHKLCGEVLAHNTRSLKFHQRLGFQQEGVLRENYLDEQQYRDVILFGLLKSERSAEV